jgi:hypothetical protein
VNVVVASDLDRTLIWSARAVGAMCGAVCVEEYDGRPLSYVDGAIVQVLETLVASGRLVPVTTRTEAQYRRVQLPGGPAKFAVCLNGGRILVDDVEDLQFRSHLESTLRGSASVAEVRPVMERWATTVRNSIGGCRLRDAEGLFIYAVFDTMVATGPQTDELRAAGSELGWKMSVQGRKIYLVPARLTKESALAYVEAAYGVRVLATAGDSLLDLGMLARFGRGWVPRDSELHKSGLQPATAVLTRGTGLNAGAEILAAMAGLMTDVDLLA